MLDLFAYLNCSHSPVIEDAWRDERHGQADGYRDVSFWTGVAQQLEAGGFTGAFFADAYNVADNYEQSIEPTLRRGQQVPENDPVVLLSAMAAATDTLGLVTTASTSLYPPYLLAKKFSTLDDLTDGRLGWNVVTSSGQLEFENAAGGYISHDERYERAAEYLEVCYKLWEDSWDDGAVVRDASGRYADPDAVSFVDHDGDYFTVPGPHMCAPTPQRTPVVFQAGQSDRGRTFAARHAEAMFSFHLSIDGFDSYATEMTERAATCGRDRDQFRLYPAITPYVAATEDLARQQRDRVIETINPETGLVRLSSHLNHDYSQYDLEAPLADIDVSGIRGALRAFVDDDRDWTVGEAAIRYARYPTTELVGTPDAVADQLETWVDVGADGFVVMPPFVPASLTSVSEHLVPELRQRGLLEAGSTDETLRERLFDGDACPPADRPARR